GIIRIGMDELLSALRNDNSRCLFGFGVAKGDSRALEAFEQAMKSPLLDKGKMLEQARNVLVHVGGGDSMTLYEVELVMQELSKHIDSSKTQILFGTGTDKKLAGNLTVTIISSLQGPGGQRREATPESSYQSPEPEPPAPRLGSPLTAPASPPPAVTPEPKNEVEPVAAAKSAEKQKTQPQPVAAAPQAAPKATVVTPVPPAEPAPAAEERPKPEPVPAKVEPVAAAAPAPAPVTPAPAKEPVVIPAAPTVEAKAPETPAPEREPVELQPVRKTAVIQAQPVRKPIIDVAPAARPKLNVGVVPVEPVTPAPAPAPEPVAPAAKAAQEWADDDAQDTIGKMLAAGASAKDDADDDQTVPVTPVRPPQAAVPVRESEGEVVVAQAGESKISLSRLVPGAPPSASEVTPGALGPAFGLGLEPGQEDADAAAAQHQQMLQLEPLSKGRFAKTEPTIVDGEDMDVPTFLRKRRK
ncbi:MAG: hypothetical protein KDM64_08215, partial [Verrucomicrobiae bacterium]|nr:hypothetical protein [Verrucomicrobiae bacterium]